MEHPLKDDEPERPSLQRVAASPAQSQEDVPATACPAVGRRPFDDLAADPRRSNAVARHRNEARPGPAGAARRRRYPSVPRNRGGWERQSDRTGRVRAAGRRAPQRTAGPPDHGVLPRRPDAPLRACVQPRREPRAGPRAESQIGWALPGAAAQRRERRPGRTRRGGRRTNRGLRPIDRTGGRAAGR